MKQKPTHHTPPGKLREGTIHTLTEFLLDILFVVFIGCVKIRDAILKIIVTDLRRFFIVQDKKVIN
jgi:hypothetical protein